MNYNNLKIKGNYPTRCKQCKTKKRTLKGTLKTNTKSNTQIIISALSNTLNNKVSSNIYRKSNLIIASKKKEVIEITDTALRKIKNNKNKTKTLIRK